MGFNVSALELHIRDILQAPGVDLATISAKRVRKRLLELDTRLTPDTIKEHKEEIDTLIASVYEQVSASAPGGEADEGYEEGDGGSDIGEGPSKRKREDTEDDVPKSSKKVKGGKKTKAELSDAELARQLSNEINGRVRAPRASATGKTPRAGKANGGKKGGKKKSAETVESDIEAGSDGQVKPKKKRGGGFTKEYGLSAPLAALIQADKMSRPQVVKHLWDHIKANGLQNPLDKREIICDAPMKAIFGVEKVNMFKMNKDLGKHLHEVGAE